ncbi:unnamed protein product [Ilex paraguariensis]|uniref:NAC domain-containing protein n=1 Tax=Ilex paraguariensis TaxID=185542 RepID=A0ABC8SBG5_9AQUA
MSNHNLPPGFRFHPTDEELIIHYLKKKVSSPTSDLLSIIADIDLYKFNPWELPGKASFGENEWFFFTPRDRKYPNGVRPNRAAGSGYWKATGTDKSILAAAGLQCLGVKKALVFYNGRPPRGVKTDWVMDEYRLLNDVRPFPRLRGSMRLDDWVLCRVRHKLNGPQQVGEKQEGRNSSCLPPLTFQPSTNEEFRKSTEKHSDQIQVYSVADNDNVEVDELALQYLSFQGGPSGTPLISDDDSHSYPRMVCHISGGITSLKRTLDRSSEDEFALPPNKRLYTATTDVTDDTNIFQIPYIPQCFSELMF